MTIKKLELIIKLVRNIEQEKGAINLVVENAKLKGIMAEKGYSVRKLSDETGIPLSTLSNKINGITEFKTSDILIISKVLEILNIQEIFLVSCPLFRYIEQNKVNERMERGIMEEKDSDDQGKILFKR
ncbi:helix-turn-helix domain-containing protein [Lagierella massiliensis]|uniref:helix-turn-helix domain-containing protein n=1 Tax=Lagierella massiliensis TaxID=1689303 RepID=UPI001651F5FE|nr:helix-turn-helix transcriptional regulator [Lagierella massiliensis]